MNDHFRFAICPLTTPAPANSTQHFNLDLCQKRKMTGVTQTGLKGGKNVSQTTNIFTRVLPYIIDLGSSNGTYLNNNRIEPQRYYELKVRKTRTRRTLQLTTFNLV